MTHSPNIETLRAAHVEYMARVDAVRRLTERHPNGLRIRPLFAPRATPPVTPVFRHQPWREAA